MTEASPLRWTVAPWRFLLLSLLPGCSPPAESDTEPRWRIVAEALPGALFSVTGTAKDDVWVVGADRGDDAGPSIAHFDGSDWETHASGLDAGDLFWVHAFEDGPVYAAGTNGALLRYDGGAFEKVPTPAERDVWGVWGPNPGDLWAVGGDANAGTGFVWRDRGDGFEPVDVGEDAPSPSAWYKVWGTASDDVWFCGVSGALMHYDGDSFEAVDAGTTRTLLTLHGRPDASRITAVGGQFSATLVSSVAGKAWRDVTPEEPTLQTFGVFHRGEAAYSVGMQTTVLRLDGDAWSEEPTGLDLYQDFHAVWIAPNDDVWATGGQIIAPPFTSGTLIHKGRTAPPAIEF
ncbi:MAG TPA: hypothetical protein VI197_27555 [Polyangiaceae bacterium]